MLTGNLLLYTRRQGRLMPRLLDPAEPRLVAGAEALLQLFAAFFNRRRGELEEALRDLALPGVPARVAQGLAKLLLDRCEFESAAAAEPQALRRELFDAAAQAWRREGAPGLTRWREDVLRSVGGGHGLAPSQVEHALYADLAENQLLTGMRPLTAEGLLYRFNVAQVQGLLLRAGQITLRSPWPSPKRLRQLFRYLKFFGLLFRQEPDGQGELVLVMDGPLSVLESGSRYGLNLAQFLPVLFLWEQPWRLSCTLIPRPGQKEARLELEPHPFLKSHYPDHGQWVAEEVRQFVERFNGLGGRWLAAPAEELVSLPGNHYLIPDFAFRSLGGGVEFQLEYLQYPSQDQLAKRLRLIDECKLDNYLLACRDVPALRGLTGNEGRVLAYRRTLLPTQVSKFLTGRVSGGE